MDPRPWPGDRLTSNQITIPREVRERLRLKTGSRVDFLVEPSGRVVLKPLDADFRSLRGIVRSRRKRPPSIKEMNRAIAEGYVGR
jgi:AbrB family looped-hinge helix DNA binding protein